MKIQAAVTHAQGKDFAIEEVTLPVPEASEVLVKIVATGMCHTDAVARDSGITAYPMVLGHEGSGIVEQIGGNVTSLAVGDHVVMNRNRAKRLLVLSALPLALLAASSQAQEPDSQWGSGKNLYDKVCSLCHAPEVGVGTAIQGRGLPEAYIKVFVRNGFNAMPAFPASFIDDEAIAQVAEYLATLPPVPTDPR